MRRKNVQGHREAAYRKTSAFVLDGSVTMGWFFDDEKSEYAEAVYASLASKTAVVPHIWFLEVMNGTLLGERRKRATLAKANQFINLIQQLPVVTDVQVPLRETLTLARAYGLTSYDAAYLELSIRRGLPLATLDRSLQAAAKDAGVERYNP